MIILTRLDGSELVLNNDLIERVEESPYTVVFMTTGNKYLVKETRDEIIKKVIEFKNKCLTGSL